MPVLDTTELDFSREHALGPDHIAGRVVVVRNESAEAVLHMGVKSPVPWLDIYPTEFALAPREAQAVTALLRPERSGQAALAPARVAVFGQYLAVRAGDAADLPPDIDLELAVIPPLSTCPNCAADLPDGARECRRCGERIRLCPVCGTPNTWLAKVCRLNPAHVIRPQNDWRMAPGGNETHALTSPAPTPARLARRWSFPAFAPTRAADALDWSAPLAAFGLVVASAIETATGRAAIHAFALASGEALWEVDLPDNRGLYPDRGAMALAEDGTLYAATLGGFVLALDAIRGTRRWESRVPGAVYGGVVASGDWLLVPAGDAVCVLARADGRVVRTLPVGGVLDTAPAAGAGRAYVCGDHQRVLCYEIATGALLWEAETDGSFDAAPLFAAGMVFAATLAGTVYALNADTGAQLWKTSVSSRPISASPALSADGLLFVGGDDGYLHIVAAETGNLIRSRRLSASPLRCAPVCTGQTVFAGADDGNVYSLDKDYTILRAYETSPGTRLASAGLALYGDWVIGMATNGVLYALQATA